MKSDTRLLVRCERVMKSCKNENQRVIGRRYADLAHKRLMKTVDPTSYAALEYAIFIDRIQDIGRSHAAKNQTD